VTGSFRVRDRLRRWAKPRWSGIGLLVWIVALGVLAIGSTRIDPSGPEGRMAHGNVVIGVTILVVVVLGSWCLHVPTGPPSPELRRLGFGHRGFHDAALPFLLGRLPPTTVAADVGQETGDRISLVLSGGGLKGAFQAGFVDELAASDVETGLISGASIGAINGYVAHQHGTDALVRLWSSGTQRIFKVRPVRLAVRLLTVLPALAAASSIGPLGGSGQARGAARLHEVQALGPGHRPSQTGLQAAMQARLGTAALLGTVLFGALLFIDATAGLVAIGLVAGALATASTRRVQHWFDRWGLCGFDIDLGPALAELRSQPPGKRLGQRVSVVTTQFRTMVDPSAAACFTSGFQMSKGANQIFVEHGFSYRVRSAALLDAEHQTLPHEQPGSEISPDVLALLQSASALPFGLARVRYDGARLPIADGGIADNVPILPALHPVMRTPVVVVVDLQSKPLLLDDEQHRLEQLARRRALRSAGSHPRWIGRRWIRVLNRHYLHYGHACALAARELQATYLTTGRNERCTVVWVRPATGFSALDTVRARPRSIDALIGEGRTAGKAVAAWIAGEGPLDDLGGTIELIEATRR